MIRLTRGNTFTDKLRAYKIFIDDIYRGDIHRDETKEFPVDNGSHVIYAKIDWCRSNKLCIDVNDSIAELEVGASLTGRRIWIPFIQILYTTFWRDEYLWIEKKDSAS